MSLQNNETQEENKKQEENEMAKRLFETFGEYDPFVHHAAPVDRWRNLFCMKVNKQHCLDPEFDATAFTLWTKMKAE